MVKKLMLPLVALWRMWFYVCVFIAIVVLFPFIFLTSITNTRYRQFFIFSRLWGWIILLLAGLWPRVKWRERPDSRGVYIICANHTSMVDIMMTFALFPNCFVFIGKKELARIPVFGYFYRRTNILVDRSSLSSKKEVMSKASAKLSEGIGLCIFPEGGVPREEVFLAPFKNGAFKLAAESGVSIIPVVYPDSKKRFPYDNSKGSPGICRAEILPFLHPDGKSEKEIEKLRDNCYQIIYAALEKYQKED